MFMRQTTAQRLECRACGLAIGNHVRGCPEGALEELVDKEVVYRCEKCGGRCRITVSDYIQCQDCKIRYCRGFANTEGAEKVLIRRSNPDEDFVEAYVLKGRRIEKLKFTIVKDKLLEQRRAWIAQRRKGAGRG